ncbi:hypothetical protein [Cellulomonas oligotrophica]|uniref:Uncharacterized protein n=1 Tax=Cellulomonas oligotrophica TaxID=931536 RepID=A0A7Y9FHZ5_9CELL|nr:hypothetical protein [Cellulomonas oligotrophica]NYD87670.1 hypothetical protein [Cellulomonas oligotrophica]
MSARPPARRVPDRRHALHLLLASGLALVGVLTVAVVYLGLGVRTLTAAAEPGAGPAAACLAAADDPAVGVRYELLPPRSLCTSVVDGEAVEVVVAEVATPVLVGGLLLAAVGVAATVVVVTRPRRRAAGDRP